MKTIEDIEKEFYVNGVSSIKEDLIELVNSDYYEDSVELNNLNSIRLSLDKSLEFTDEEYHKNCTSIIEFFKTIDSEHMQSKIINKDKG